MSEMTTTALTSWYGSNRLLAEHVGTELRGCAWVLVPFAGGMSEVPYIGARTLLVADLHRHLINLAKVVADRKLRPALSQRLRGLLFHPDVLDEAQERCRSREAAAAARAPDLFSTGACVGGGGGEAPDLDWAVDYFVASWMGRGGRAGTKGEFNGGLSVRWDAGGGDSNARYRSAVRSLVAWHNVFRDRCNFVCDDGFKLLREVKDTDDPEKGGPVGVYCDPPFPKGGDPYRHTFKPSDHQRLAKELRRFEGARVVLRYYDHPLIRELYPEGRWTWVRRVGRKSTNDEAPEVLILNGVSLAAGVAA